MTSPFVTERLVVRPWDAADAAAALAVYTAPPVARWLAPHAEETATVDAMRSTLLAWREGDRAGDGCEGHWAVLTRGDEKLVGGLSLQYVPTGGENLTLAWALAPAAWGRGYAAEAGGALIRWAIHEAGVPEVFAILRPDNHRALATAERMGMEWATELGHGQGFRIYRVRHGDLGVLD